MLQHNGACEAIKIRFIAISSEFFEYETALLIVQQKTFLHKNVKSF